MSLRLKRFLILSTWLLGGLACILGGVYLRRAVIQCEELYRFAETVGSQVESDIDYYTHESRRAFLYALTMDNPNVQLPYIDESRQAEIQVRDTLRHIRSLNLSPDARQLAQRFESSWTVYGQVRDAIVAHILIGDTAEAVRVDHLRGRDSFETALRDLHLLKTGLQTDAKRQSTRVRATLQTSIVALGVFVGAMLTILGGLVKANRDRMLAFQGLSKAQASEQKRSAILEMVSTQAPLLNILDTILGLPSNIAVGTGAAIWAGDRTELQFLTTKNLPAAFVLALREIKYPTAIEDASDRLSDEERFHEDAFGLITTNRIPLHNAAGRPIGLLQLFAPAGRPAPTSPTLVAQMAQLAAIAIENRFMYERLAFQAQHDILTELPNRLLFHDRVQQAIKLARRENTTLAVVWLDLDRFKQVNDGLGHRAGDEVLCEVARRLSSCLRDIDTVARIGGDEFTLLLGGLASVANVGVVLRNILHSIAQPMTINKNEVTITASAGVSAFPDHGDEPGALMRNADLAMYSAKHLGRNGYQMFAVQLGESMQRRLEMESALKSALDRNEFSLEYQPLIAQGGRLDGLEALLRWKSSTLGQISPVEFIPIVEDMGLMSQLGEWVIRTACQNGVKWLKAGYDVPRIAVNVSGVQFVDGSLTATVRRALDDFALPPNKLEIEVTESVLINNIGHVIEQIESLRHLGVKFAIDDFGTGYSSLSQLRTLPVDVVKIDRSFIKDLCTNAIGSTALVRGIVALAHSLQLKVVAEGVETEEQLAMLATLGCDVSQGFFLYRPMPSSAVEAILLRSTAEAVDSTCIAACDPTPDERVRAWLADRIPVYLGRREADVDAIERALARDDLQCIQDIGHNMKGSGSSYGFCKITEIGDHLESAAKASDRAEITALSKDLNGYLKALIRSSPEVNDHAGVAHESRMSARGPIEVA